MALSLNGHCHCASAFCDITECQCPVHPFSHKCRSQTSKMYNFSGVPWQNTPPNGMFSTIWDIFIFSKRVWATAEQWKRIVGMLYLSMPPFGPRNARAYFPIMALSCKQLPWEAGCSPRSAVRAQPTVLYVSVWLCARVCVCMHFGGGRECVLYTALWWASADEGQLLCRAYYSRRARGGLSVAAAAIH